MFLSPSSGLNLLITVQALHAFVNVGVLSRETYALREAK